MKPRIAIFYHCLFSINGEPLANAVPIISEQMAALKQSGLLDEASEMIVGINGGDEALELATKWLPKQANLVYHGLQCRNENRTLVLLENWLDEIGSEEWYVFYHHAKGATHPPNHGFSTRWRGCMMHHLVTNWRQCVKNLDEGCESVGCHRMEPPKTPASQYIWAGNFWWARSSYLKTLPSIYDRARIVMSGIDSIESRYESEVWIGNGPRQPKLYDYHTNWDPSKIGTCTQ